MQYGIFILELSYIIVLLSFFFSGYVEIKSRGSVIYSMPVTEVLLYLSYFCCVLCSCWSSVRLSVFCGLCAAIFGWFVVLPPSDHVVSILAIGPL